VSQAKLSYRAEVDGLRAVAVISVILYHARMVVFGRNWFEGGYIGVDIFFVISGYLITRIILSELQADGSFSFLKFYERRARRILPMLFVVILASIPFAWQILLPSDLVEYTKSILASLFFGSNFFFYFSTTKYGAESALLKPFLHTWSLGVEEQFYFVFPIVAIIAYKFFRKHFLTILVALALLSLLFAEQMETRNPELNFFLPFSRFWELAAGSFLAYRELNYGQSDGGRLHPLFSIAGLCLVAYGIFFFDGNTPHPGFHTVIPILGVALIIGFASKDQLVGKILGSTPFVSIGLISYSAYLWHFPLFAFWRYSGDRLANYDKIGLIAVTLVLSTLSYQLVEKPFRSKFVNKKVFVWASLVSSVGLVVFSAYVIKTVDYKDVEERSRYSYRSILDKGAFLEVWLDQAMEEEALTDFTDDQSKKVLIVGNSHAVDLFRVLSSAPLYENIDFGLISQNRNTDNYQVSCFYNFLVNDDNTCGEKDTRFNDISAKLRAADLIILKTRWQEEDLDVLENLVQILSNKLHKNLLIVGNAFEQRPKIVLREFLMKNKALPDAEELNKLEEKVFRLARHKKVEGIDNRLMKIAAKTNVPFLSAKNFFCDYEARRCKIFTEDGYLILWDYGHLTTKGADYIGQVVSALRWGDGLINGQVSDESTAVNFPPTR